MVFRRRDRLPLFTRLANFVFPKGGWVRAASYVWHRVRRLPDPPHRIARGVFAGILVSFTPLFGFHFILAALVGYLIRANILAALLATFLGNPLTFPLIAGSALATGDLILGHGGNFSIPQIMAAFSGASGELWHNLMSPFTGAVPRWSSLARFYTTVFLPYLVGGILPGTLAGLAGYYVTIPLVAAYQLRRRKRLRERFVAGAGRAPGRAGPGGGAAPGPAAVTVAAGAAAPPPPPRAAEGQPRPPGS
ncbi:MAG: DUF2062 domain-containing protein [Rhodobacteraceae bacterium]|nr:DUF2062 domain-containing protein [Paracoccaceae bacterium]